MSTEVSVTGHIPQTKSFTITNKAKKLTAKVNHDETDTDTSVDANHTVTFHQEGKYTVSVNNIDTITVRFLDGNISIKKGKESENHVNFVVSANVS